MKKHHLFNAGELEGYQKYLGTPGTTTKSGCGLYIKNDIKFMPRRDLDISYFDDENEYQCKWIEIINEAKINIVIGVYYRHPKHTSNGKFNEDLKTTLTKINKENKMVILCGDFNYDLLKFNKNNHINQFINTMTEEYLQPTILEPTRYVGNTQPSLIDNIFINNIDKIITSGNIIDKITDHMPNFIIVEDFISHRKRRKYKKRNFKNFDKNAYINDLEQIQFK